MRHQPPRRINLVVFQIPKTAWRNEKRHLERDATYCLVTIRNELPETMARSRTLDIRRPAAHEDVHRVYVVNRDSDSAQGRCNLDDGSAVLCAFETIEMAIEATTDDPSLRLVRHRSLSPQEQERVEAALLA